MIQCLYFVRHKEFIKMSSIKIIGLDTSLTFTFFTNTFNAKFVKNNKLWYELRVKMCLQWADRNFKHN
jgi:predicted membrane chloride channel (bestrophin family)